MTFFEVSKHVLDCLVQANLFYLASTHPTLYTKNPVHKLFNLGYYVFRMVCYTNLLFAVALVVGYVTIHVSWH